MRRIEMLQMISVSLATLAMLILIVIAFVLDKQARDATAAIVAERDAHVAELRCLRTDLRWMIEHRTESGFQWHYCANGEVWQAVVNEWRTM